MIICHCLGLSDRDICRSAVAGGPGQGAGPDAGAAGTLCGGCALMVDELRRATAAPARDAVPAAPTR